MDILHFTDCHNNNKLFNFDYGWLTTVSIILQSYLGPMWLWSYGSWIYMCNQCLSPLKLWVRTPFMARCIRYNIIWCSLPVTFDRSVVFFGYSDFHANKTDLHDITEILLKVALNTINQTNQLYHCIIYLLATEAWVLQKTIELPQVQVLQYSLPVFGTTSTILQNDIYSPKISCIKKKHVLKMLRFNICTHLRLFWNLCTQKRIVKLINISIIIP